MKYRISFSFCLEDGERIEEETILGTDTPRDYVTEYAAREGEYRAQEHIRARGYDPATAEYCMNMTITPIKGRSRRKKSRR